MSMPDESTTKARGVDYFIENWNGQQNFLMDRSQFPLDYDFPSPKDFVEALRCDEKVRISMGIHGSEYSDANPKIAEDFNALPIEEALKEDFHIAHFELHRFYGSGQILDGFKQQVLIPWQQFLKDQGFQFQRCYPIIFISGSMSPGNYHMDQSHVLAWQLYGGKEFNGFSNPGSWEPVQKCVDAEYRSSIQKPDTIPDDARSALAMEPGDLLWNQFLTPHWVDASADGIAISLNISHGGIMRNGEYAPNEKVLREHNPDPFPANENQKPLVEW